MKHILIPLTALSLTACATLTPEEQANQAAASALIVLINGEAAMREHCPSALVAQAIRMAGDVAAQSQAIAFTMDQLRQRNEARATTDRVCGFPSP